MWGSGRHGTPPAGRLRTLWGTFAGTYNIVREGTSSGHHFALQYKKNLASFLSLLLPIPIRERIGVTLTTGNRLLQVFNSSFLTLRAVALLMIQPTKLLKYFGMPRIMVQDSGVGILGVLKLQRQ